MGSLVTRQLLYAGRLRVGRKQRSWWEREQLDTYALVDEDERYRRMRLIEGPDLHGKVMDRICENDGRGAWGWGMDRTDVIPQVTLIFAQQNPLTRAMAIDDLTISNGDLYEQ